MMLLSSASDWLTVDKISTLLLIGSVLAAGWIWFRGGGGAAISSLEVANRALSTRVQELEHQVREDAKTIATLTARTDIAVALEPIVSWTHEHERRDQARFDSTLRVLDLIARRLGADPEAD